MFDAEMVEIMEFAKTHNIDEVVKFVGRTLAKVLDGYDFAFAVQADHARNVIQIINEDERSSKCGEIIEFSPIDGRAIVIPV